MLGLYTNRMYQLAENIMRVGRLRRCVKNIPFPFAIGSLEELQADPKQLPRFLLLQAYLCRR